MGGFPVDEVGHESHGGDKDQAFSHIAFVKDDLAEGRRYTAFVSAVPDPFDHAVQKPSRMEMGFEFPAVVTMSDTVPVHPEDQFRSLTCPHRVPVDTDDAGNGAAVGLHVGWTVMGLARNGVVMAVVESGHPGIIPEHGNDPILFLFDLEGWALDTGFKEIIDGFTFTGRKIPVPEKPLEGVMVAVIAAGLGDIFKLDVRG